MFSFTTSDDRCEWLQENTMSAYKMLELHLTMDLRNGNSQIMHNYGSGGKLDASMAYAIAQLLEEGRIEKVDYSPDYFISPISNNSLHAFLKQSLAGSSRAQISILCAFSTTSVVLTNALRIPTKNGPSTTLRVRTSPGQFQAMRNFSVRLT